MASSIIQRFDFDTVAAGFLYTIQNPELYGRLNKYIDPEMLWQHDTSPNVVAFRAIIGVAKEIWESSDSAAPISPHFLNTKAHMMLTGTVREGCIALTTRFMRDETIAKKMADTKCFDAFVDYLKITTLAKDFGKFSEKYQLGDIIEASKILQGTLATISTINASEVSDFDPDEVWDILNGKESTFDYQSLTTGCDPLDTEMGSMERQTLNVVISVTNGGKTMFSHHIIAQAIRAKLPIHVAVVEDRKASFTRRIIACLTGIDQRMLKRDTLKALSSEQVALVEAAKVEMKLYLKVQFMYGMGIEAIHQRKLEYDMLLLQKGKPRVVVDIVDYTGHIARLAPGDKRHEQVHWAFSERKNYVLKHGKIGIDFAQINREGQKRLNDKGLLTHADLAGGFDLAQVCDSIISINRNSMDVSANKAVLYLCKSRDGAAGGQYQVGTNFKAARWNMKDCTWMNAPADYRKSEESKSA